MVRTERNAHRKACSVSASWKPQPVVCYHRHGSSRVGAGLSTENNRTRPNTAEVHLREKPPLVVESWLYESITNTTTKGSNEGTNSWTETPESRIEFKIFNRQETIFFEIVRVGVIYYWIRLSVENLWPISIFYCIIADKYKEPLDIWRKKN